MARKLPRCVFEDEFGRRCRARGTGKPALCAKHSALFDEPPDTVELLEDLVAGEATLEDIIGFVYPRIVHGLRERQDPRRRREYQGPGRAYASQWPPQGSSGTGRGHAHREAPAQPTPPEDPREILHFSPNQALTREEVRARRKQLAAMVHPDRGGSTEAMQRINRAADALLSQLS